MNVADLTPGDRVLLACPTSRRAHKHEAQFLGISESIAGAFATGAGLQLMDTTTAAFISGRKCARFLFERTGATDFIALFAIGPDGAMRDDEDRQIFIESRARMGQG